MEESRESLVKVERAEEAGAECQREQLIDIKSEKLEASPTSEPSLPPPPPQKTENLVVKIEDNQVPTISDVNNLIDDDVEDISSEEEDEDELESISDDEDDDKFEEDPKDISTSIITDTPTTSSTALFDKSEDNHDSNNSSSATSLPQDYYNPLTKNEEDLKYLIKMVTEDPRMMACNYCWRVGHFRAKCNDRLWYGELNKNCVIWMEGCSKRRQVYFELKPETLEKMKELKMMKNKKKRKMKRVAKYQVENKEESEGDCLPPGDEIFEVVEELQSSEDEGEEEDEQGHKVKVLPPVTEERVNLILKNEEDLKFLRRCLTGEEVDPSSRVVCNYCSRAGHVKMKCEDRKIREGIKACPIWRKGVGERRQLVLELQEGAKEAIKERARKANQRRRIVRKKRKVQRLEEEQERREEEEKRRKIEAAEMLLEIVNELLEGTNK